MGVPISANSGHLELGILDRGRSQVGGLMAAWKKRNLPVFCFFLFFYNFQMFSNEHRLTVIIRIFCVTLSIQCI